MAEILTTKDLIHLRNARVSYAIHILPGGIPMHLYFGARLETVNPAPILRRCGLPADGTFSVQECMLDHTPQEYPVFGLGDMREGALCVRRLDGTRTADLRVEQMCVEDGKPKLEGLPATFGEGCKTLRLILADDQLNMRVTLLYTIFDDCDGIARSVRVENNGSLTLCLQRIMSLCLDLTDGRFDLLTLQGGWSREREMIRRPLVPGEQSTSAVRGASGMQTSPFMALLRPEATEQSGEVYGFALVYSGNFYAGVHVDQHRMPRAMIGVNDYDFEWVLEPGESLQSPEAVMVYSREGLGGISEQFHCLCAQHLVRGRYAHAPRPILINNWEATYFGFTQQKLLDIAKTAADAGIELFVLDDGWFGKRDDDTTSLGDWTTDLNKLPDGLAAVAEGVHALGMKFGLWFEPEMISKQSALYQAHPDWCMHVSGREAIESRHQLVLDLSRADVCEYIFNAVSAVLSQNKIDYVKWDMNRNMTNIGSAWLSPERQRELPHRYILGLYQVLERLNAAFPNVLFESCASGGGRFDMGMLYYMPQTWCSDNTDALTRCKIQYSTSLVFPPFAIGSHVSAVPNHQTGRCTPLSTRANVAMSGCFGYELDLNALTKEEREEIAQQVARVKALRETLLYGSFYRLLSPYDGNDTAWMTVSKDRREAVLTLVRAQALSNTLPPMVALRGLDDALFYRIEQTGEVYSGAELMQMGLCCPLPSGDAASVSYTLSVVAPNG